MAIGELLTSIAQARCLFALQIRVAQSGFSQDSFRSPGSDLRIGGMKYCYTIVLKILGANLIFRNDGFSDEP